MLLAEERRGLSPLIQQTVAFLRSETPDIFWIKAIVGIEDVHEIIESLIREGARTEAVEEVVESKLIEILPEWTQFGLRGSLARDVNTVYTDGYGPCQPEDAVIKGFGHIVAVDLPWAMLPGHEPRLGRLKSWSIADAIKREPCLWVSRGTSREDPVDAKCIWSCCPGRTMWRFFFRVCTRLR